ncbi:hypothetical protein DPMN_059581 [Dreissena polymorpha]|uniref:Uncharacterized protein n=1 Tax=Dreissena polymorpha TaxID=45954 RepID=A0A9D4C4B6_DREPO|nr:hypothetical protein DPMN_059581 [Dreissena polymorpha]
MMYDVNAVDAGPSSPEYELEPLGSSYARVFFEYDPDETEQEAFMELPENIAFTELPENIIPITSVADKRFHVKMRNTHKHSYTVLKAKAHTLGKVSR